MLNVSLFFDFLALVPGFYKVEGGLMDTFSVEVEVGVAGVMSDVVSSVAIMKVDSDDVSSSEQGE